MGVYAHTEGMPYDPIHDQLHGGLKCAKMAKDFKGYLLHQHGCNQKTNGELQYSETISKC